MRVKAVRKCDDDWRHEMFADEAIKPFGHILLESSPIGVRQATAGRADQVDKQGQPATVVSSGDVDVDDARPGIAEDVAFQGFALDDKPMDGAHRA